MPTAISTKKMLLGREITLNPVQILWKSIFTTIFYLLTCKQLLCVFSLCFRTCKSYKKRFIGCLLVRHDFFSSYLIFADGSI